MRPPHTPAPRSRLWEGEEGSRGRRGLSANPVIRTTAPAISCATLQQRKQPCLCCAMCRSPLANSVPIDARTAVQVLSRAVQQAAVQLLAHLVQAEGQGEG